MTESGSGPREVTAEEQRNVATAYEHMAAAMAHRRDAAEGRKRLIAIQFGLQPIDGGLVVGEGMASVEAVAPTGFVHSFVVSFG